MGRPLPQLQGVSRATHGADLVGAHQREMAETDRGAADPQSGRSMARDDVTMRAEQRDRDAARMS
jgi:hypothetical protein